MNTYQEHPTHGKIMQRVAKTPLNIYGVKPIETIPVDKQSIIILGGERTHSIKEANHYASLMETLVRFYKIKDIDIYSAYYEFENDSWDRRNERKIAFIKARSKILNHEKIPNIPDTKYIDELYNLIIRPRIIRDEKRMSNTEASQNLRHVIFYVHCHGAAVLRGFQDIMATDMRKVGYSIPEIHDIMKNVLVIQHAPTAPLEKSKFNTVSFMSANDTLMNFNNKFSKYATEHSEDMFPSYFPLGNFFAVYGFTHQLINEHQIVGLVPNIDQDMLSSDGAIIMAAERNSIINGITAAIKNTPIPSTEDLIAPVFPTDKVKPDFDELTQNGKLFMRIMRNNIHKSKSNEH